MKALVYDFGLCIEHARRLLGNKIDTVYYYVPWQDAFPRFLNALIGRGYEDEGLIRIERFWDYIDEVDLIVVFDTYLGDLVHFLRNKGYLVFGTGQEEILENDRYYAKKLQKKLGLQTQDFERIVGFEKLKQYLKENKNKVVKLNTYRGSLETFTHIDYKSSEPLLEHLEVELSVAKNYVEFLVEDFVGVIEPGTDFYVVDGEYPDKVLWGYEKKGCYDEQTEILTDKGWKYFKDLDGTERVLTLNISDNRHYTIEWQKPTRYICYDYEGKMLEIKNNNVDLLITPDHNLLVLVGEQNTKSGKLIIEKNGKKYYTGRRERKLIKAKDLDLSKPFCMPFPNPKLKSGEKNFKIQIGKHKFTKKQLAILLGFYLSEGCVDKRGRITISQFKYVKEFEKRLNELPVKFKKTKYGFSLSDKDLANYLRQFGKAGDRFIPDIIKNSSQYILKTFLECFCLGDGSELIVYKATRNKKKEKIARKYYTKSKKLADDLQEILIKCGIQSTITKHKNRELYTISEHPIYRKNFISKGQAKWVNYKGKVYCVTVPNHIIMVRRNGKPIWCGNSGYVAKVEDYNNIPKALKDITDTYKKVFKQYQARTFYSTEVRVDEKGKGYLIDNTLRMPMPCPSSCEMVAFKNWDEIIIEGAKGNLVNPVIDEDVKYLASVSLESDWADNHWLAVEIPEEYRQFIKFRKHLKDGDKYYAIPGFSSICAVVGYGKTLDEAIDMCIKIAEQVKAYQIEYNFTGLQQIKEDIEKGEKLGLKFF
jgi:hypothetical protein